MDYDDEMNKSLNGIFLTVKLVNTDQWECNDSSRDLMCQYIDWN